MLYTAGEILFFLVISGALGVLVGYFTWGRRKGSAPDSDEVESLKRQLQATRKRAAAAEADAAKRGDALKEAKALFETQEGRIRELEGNGSVEETAELPAADKTAELPAVDESGSDQPEVH